jgi:hypothetical protein
MIADHAVISGKHERARSGHLCTQPGIIGIRMVTGPMDHSDTVRSLWRARGGLSAELTAAAAQSPPAHDAGPAEGQAPEEQLRAVVTRLSQALEWSVSAGTGYQPLGSALVFRPRPARSLHVVGRSPLAGEFRRLITSGAVPGWDLHPVPPGRTKLEVLAGPLLRRTGSRRFYNLLERHGFAYVEEVAATPDECLLTLRNSGPRLIAVVRAVIGELGAPGNPCMTGNIGAGPASGLGHDPAGARCCAACLGSAGRNRRTAQADPHLPHVRAQPAPRQANLRLPRQRVRHQPRTRSPA